MDAVGGDSTFTPSPPVTQVPKDQTTPVKRPEPSVKERSSSVAKREMEAESHQEGVVVLVSSKDPGKQLGDEIARVRERLKQETDKVGKLSNSQPVTTESRQALRQAQFLMNFHAKRLKNLESIASSATFAGFSEATKEVNEHLGKAQGFDQGKSKEAARAKVGVQVYNAQKAYSKAIALYDKSPEYIQKGINVLGTRIRAQAEQLTLTHDQNKLADRLGKKTTVSSNFWARRREAIVNREMGEPGSQMVRNANAALSTLLAKYLVLGELTSQEHEQVSKLCSRGIRYFDQEVQEMFIRYAGSTSTDSLINPDLWTKQIEIDKSLNVSKAQGAVNASPLTPVRDARTTSSSSTPEALQQEVAGMTVRTKEDLDKSRVRLSRVDFDILFNRGNISTIAAKVNAFSLRTFKIKSYLSTVTETAEKATQDKIQTETFINLEKDIRQTRQQLELLDRELATAAANPQLKGSRSVEQLKQQVGMLHEELHKMGEAYQAIQETFSQPVRDAIRMTQKIEKCCQKPKGKQQIEGFREAIRQYKELETLVKTTDSPIAKRECEAAAQQIRAQYQRIMKQGQGLIQDVLAVTTPENLKPHDLRLKVSERTDKCVKLEQKRLRGLDVWKQDLKAAELSDTEYEFGKIATKAPIDLMARVANLREDIEKLALSTKRGNGRRSDFCDAVSAYEELAKIVPSSGPFSDFLQAEKAKAGQAVTKAYEREIDHLQKKRTEGLTGRPSESRLKTLSLREQMVEVITPDSLKPQRKRLSADDRLHLVTELEMMRRESGNKDWSDLIDKGFKEKNLIDVVNSMKAEGHPVGELIQLKGRMKDLTEKVKKASPEDTLTLLAEANTSVNDLEKILSKSNTGQKAIEGARRELDRLTLIAQPQRIRDNINSLQQNMAKMKASPDSLETLGSLPKFRQELDLLKSATTDQSKFLSEVRELETSFGRLADRVAEANKINAARTYLTEWLKNDPKDVKSEKFRTNLCLLLAQGLYDSKISQANAARNFLNPILKVLNDTTLKDQVLSDPHINSLLVAYNRRYSTDESMAELDKQMAEVFGQPHRKAITALRHKDLLESAGYSEAAGSLKGVQVLEESFRDELDKIVKKHVTPLEKARAASEMYLAQAEKLSQVLKRNTAQTAQYNIQRLNEKVEVGKRYDAFKTNEGCEANEFGGYGTQLVVQTRDQLKAVRDELAKDFRDPKDLDDIAKKKQEYDQLTKDKAWDKVGNAKEALEQAKKSALEKAIENRKLEKLNEGIEMFQKLGHELNAIVANSTNEHAITVLGSVINRSDMDRITQKDVSKTEKLTLLTKYRKKVQKNAEHAKALNTLAINVAGLTAGNKADEWQNVVPPRK